MNRSHISKRKILTASISVVLASAGAYWGQPLIHGKADAINLIVTMFSILAGFLVAIVALVSDVSMVPGRTWKGAVMAKKPLMRRLRRHKLLFLVYLVTIVAILLSLLVDGTNSKIVIWLERGYLFLAIFGIFYSFQLPWALARLQEERLDLIIAQRKQERRTANARPAGDSSHEPTP